MPHQVVVTVSDLHVFGSDIAPLDVETVAASDDLLTLKNQPDTGAGIKGTLGELWLAGYLLRHGYEPYFPLPGRSAKSDLLAVHMQTGRVVRVQVRSRYGDGGFSALAAVSGKEITAQIKFVVGKELPEL